jgi:electron transport complex protein RnfG
MSERTLPTVGENAGGPPPPPERDDPPALRLLGTLGVAGALAGLLLVMVHQWTQPRILAHQAAVLEAAIQEVLSGPERYETLFVVDGALTAELPSGVDSLAVERVFVGYDAGGQPVGVAIPGAKPGFQDVIRLIFGFDPSTDAVLGMKVLESKETPGLGDKIEKDSSFVGGFAGVLAPLLGVKAGAGTGDPHEIDMITGATISSRTIITIINERVDELAPELRAYAAATWARAAESQEELMGDESVGDSGGPPPRLGPEGQGASRSGANGAAPTGGDGGGP